MSIEHSYFSVSRFFDAWVRVMELHTRRMEVEESRHFGSKVLIISPPTDPGIRLIAKANQHGQTQLLCFSERLERIAITNSRERGIESLGIHVAPFFRLRFVDGELAAVYANCFFDFCKEQDFAAIFDEIWRVLKVRGSLHMVYMGSPTNFLSHGWTWAFRRLNFLSQGCHPVSIGPYLSRHGFLLQKDLFVERLGFPLRYTYAEKQEKLA